MKDLVEFLALLASNAIEVSADLRAHWDFSESECVSDSHDFLASSSARFSSVSSPENASGSSISIIGAITLSTLASVPVVSQGQLVKKAPTLASTSDGFDSCP